MKRRKTPPPRLLILQAENGSIIDVISDDPALKGVKVGFLRYMDECEWDESADRPTAFLVQHRNDHESIARLADLGFFVTVNTDQKLTDNMRDIEGFNFNISLLLDSAFRMEEVMIGCERLTKQHFDPLYGTAGYVSQQGLAEV